MADPRSTATEIENHPQLPAGEEERFTGYGVMAQPFAAGHILALRRFAATSIGPPYTSVWHRDPVGRWTFRITGEPLQCCNRYFGRAVEQTIRCEIALDWTNDQQVTITTGDGAIQWTVTMVATPITRVMNASCTLIPHGLWQQPFAPAMTGALAGGLLRSGRMSLRGAVPNGQRFLSNPPSIWMVGHTEAMLDGDDLGPAGALPVQDHLEDFWLPQRGLFYAGSVQFEPYDGDRHQLVATRGDVSPN
jgi:hypothetical protein